MKDEMQKYINILNESSQPKQQLDEGVEAIIKKLAQKAMAALPQDQLKDLATQVKQATGGDFSLTKANAQKVVQALGLEQEVQTESAATDMAHDEEWASVEDRERQSAIDTRKPTTSWKGWVARLVHTASLGGVGKALAVGAGGFMGLKLAAGVGFVLLMIAGIVWTSGKVYGAQSKDRSQPEDKGNFYGKG